MHGTDADIDPNEMDMVRKLIRDRSDSSDSASAVLDDVLLMYVGRTGADMLATSIASLEQTLTQDERIQILQDLANIASADGVLYPNEIHFIVNVARQWGLEDFLASD
jgi:uncharacterized tellurite resistance protein B-like protein